MVMWTREHVASHSKLSSPGLVPGIRRVRKRPSECAVATITADPGRLRRTAGSVGDEPRDDSVAREERVMWDELQFAFALAVSGLSIGLMYSLIALGFVLVYKATDAINFAQGEFVMLAGFVAALVARRQGHARHRRRRRRAGGHDRCSASRSSASCCGRCSAGRSSPSSWPPSASAPSCAGCRRSRSAARRARVSLPIGDTPISLLDRPRCRRSRSWAWSSRWLFLGVFTWFFLKSRMGVAMRAVADNQQVAMAMGINVERYFALAWAMAGTVSALGGVIWGSMLGVDVHLALVGLKVFPVVILGGLDSILGAVVGGLIVGLVESLAAGYLDPYVGGGTKDFAPYVLMIIALMFKPYGMFGTHRIERV